MSSYLIPNVVESTARGERVTDVFSRLLGERIVFVGTWVDDAVANVVIAQLLHLAADNDRDIALYVNSPGGVTSAVTAIYDTMQFVHNDVATLCVGQASSAAALLVAGGVAGKRAVLPHARIVLTQPRAEVSRGALSDLAVEAAELERVRGEADALLAAHTGRTASEINDDTDRALVLVGDAAVTYGIADTVVDHAARIDTSVALRA